MFTFKNFPPQRGEDITFDKNAVAASRIGMVDAGAVFATILLANVPVSEGEHIQQKYGELKGFMVDEAFEGERKNAERLQFNAGFWSVIDRVVGEKLVEEARIGVEA